MLLHIFHNNLTYFIHSFYGCRFSNTSHSGDCLVVVSTRQFVNTQCEMFTWTNRSFCCFFSLKSFIAVFFIDCLPPGDISKMMYKRLFQQPQFRFSQAFSRCCNLYYTRNNLPSLFDTAVVRGGQKKLTPPSNITKRLRYHFSQMKI